LNPKVSLPVGKIPTDLLDSLLSEVTIQDDAVIIGPGVGRDAAAVDLDHIVLVIKSDPVTFATSDAPIYLVNVNANDVACLGATPKWMMATVLLPEGGSSPELVRTLIHQLRDSCAKLNIALIGGHTEVTAGVPRPLLVGTLIGTVPQRRLLAPGGANIGDRLVITRPVAVEGTALLAIERSEPLRRQFGSAFVERASALLHDPGISVVADAGVLLATGAVSALHDPTEGGVFAGVREIAMAAGKGAVIDSQLVPQWPETEIISRYFGIDSLGMLASGSLIAAVHPSKMAEVQRSCKASGVPLAVFGKITSANAGFRVVENGATREMPSFATDEVSRALASVPAD
jgi:hydrogenase expression/formation protein HypE